MKIERHGRRFWRVYDEDGSLVAVTAYLKGAREVMRRLSAARGRPAVHEETGPYPRPDETLSEAPRHEKGEQ